MKPLPTRFTFINPENRSEVTAFIKERWLTTNMVIRGAVVDMTRVDGIIGFSDSRIAALITYTIKEHICEITSLDSLQPNQGLATALLNRVIEVARNNHCEKIIVVTTNDNIHAIRFYQKRGFDLVRLYHNALDLSRKLKPEIPMLGMEGIPLQHELEFELIL